MPRIVLVLIPAFDGRRGERYPAVWFGGCELRGRTQPVEVRISVNQKVSLFVCRDFFIYLVVGWLVVGGYLHQLRFNLESTQTGSTEFRKHQERNVCFHSCKNRVQNFRPMGN